MENQSINPFTGMSNEKSIRLQKSWENILSNEFDHFVLNFDDIEHTFTKSCLTHPSFEQSDISISYEQMCPSSINFSFEIKI